MKHVGEHQKGGQNPSTQGTTNAAVSPRRHGWQVTEETFCDSLSLLHMRQREWGPFKSGRTTPRSTKDVEIPRLGQVTS